MLPQLPSVTMDEVIANSFRDYHVKGFDYICLRRSPTETVKLYFFDGDVSKLPEVVNPHDHRYDFETLCIAGAVENIWFQRGGDPRQPGFSKWDYWTPLNGGHGFEYRGSEVLRETSRHRATAGRSYDMQAQEIHTIRLVENETVIALVQHEDCVPRDRPTTTWTRGFEPPSLEGLYSRFAADTIRKRLLRLKERVPSLQLPEIV